MAALSCTRGAGPDEHSRHSAAASGQLMPLLELHRLEQCLQRVATSSSGTLALVAGEAGAGKTALVREFGERQWAGSAC
jgi:predicted ATPase